MKNLLIFGLVLMIGIAGGGYLVKRQKSDVKIAEVNSFEECAAAGNAVMESYPEQCRTEDGKSFTREIGNELEFSGLIHVTSPRPGQVVSSPLEVTGQARGTWFFEANFSVGLVDGEGKSLGVGIAQAEGEWMTEELVPFRAELVFTKPVDKSGKLFIRNANPSGLAENEKVLEMPVRFE